MFLLSYAGGGSWFSISLLYCSWMILLLSGSWGWFRNTILPIEVSASMVLSLFLLFLINLKDTSKLIKMTATPPRARPPINSDEVLPFKAGVSYGPLKFDRQ